MKKFKNLIYSLLFVFLFFASSKGQAKKEITSNAVAIHQSYTSKSSKLNKSQGTNEYQNVHCILQDKDCNFWIGTTGEGVYKYDGNEFVQFTEKDGLSNNKVWSIIEDKLGNIWFGTDDGVSKYDGKMISKIPFTISKSNSFSISPTRLGANIVWDIFQDSKGTIWFGSDYGIYCYNGESFTYFLNNLGITNNNKLTLRSVQCMLEDAMGNLWFETGPQSQEGLILFDGKSLTNFKPKDEGWLRKLTRNKNGDLLLTTRHNGLVVFNGKTFSEFPLPQNLRKELLTAILVDSKGNVWFGSDYTNDNDISLGGLWKFDGNSFIEYSKKDGLNNTSIYALTEDKKGHIWIGTRNCGLYRYNGHTVEIFSD